MGMGNRTYGADRPHTKAFLEKHLCDAISVITRCRNVAAIPAHDACSDDYRAGYDSAMKLVLSIVGVVAKPNQHGE